MKKQLEYFITEEDKAKCLRGEEARAIDIDCLSPFICFNNDEFYVSVKKERLQNGEELYFDVEFNEGEESKTIIISDGTQYLPVCIADIVTEQDYFCVAVRHIDGMNKNSEEISLIIYFASEGKLHFSDMVHPAGRHAEIYITVGPDYGCYLASYNGHLMVIGNDDDFECSGHPTTKRLGVIDYIDMRGIKFLEQCLNYRVKYISNKITNGVRSATIK